MDENNNKENSEFSVNIDKEELKNQTKDTVNQAKETIKNMDFKKEAGATKGFLIEMISTPFTTIQKVATEQENCFSNAIMFMIFWMIVEGLDEAIRSYSSIKSVILSVIAPIILVLAFTVATVLFGGKEKKSITTILSSIIIANVPKIIAGAVSVVCGLVNKIFSISLTYRIDSIVASTCGFIATALTFIAIKELITKDEDDKMFRKIAVIALVTYSLVNICVLLGIY